MTSNVRNRGIAHLSHKAGGQPFCKSSRAHIVVAIGDASKWGTICKRCESKAAKMRRAQVSFKCSEEDRRLARGIARRARDLLLEHSVDRPAMDIEMDVVATHCNGNPLRLADLLAADDFNFMHDLAGIARHLNRETGKLGGAFSPRFSLREAA